MSVNPFSFVLVFGLIALLIKNWNAPLETHIKNLFLCAVFLTLSTNVGFFMSIGSLEIGYSFFITILLFLLCIVYLLGNGKFNKKLFGFGFLFCIFAVFGVVHSFIEPYRYGVVQNSWDAYVAGEEQLSYSPVFSLPFNVLFGFLRYPFVLAVVFQIFKKEDYVRALDITRILTDGIIVYGFVELVGKFLFKINFTEIFLDPVFGNAYPTLSGAERLQGLFKEPSHYAQGLLYLSVLNLFSIRLERNRNKKVWAHCRMAGLILLLLFSTSFSALFYIIAVVALYPVVCYGVKARYIIGIGAFSAALAALCMNRNFMQMIGLENLYERIDRAIKSIEALFAGKNATASSEGARFTSIYFMIEILLHRPLFGIGIGITDAHSTIFAVLANFGLVGFFLWGAILIYYGKIKKNGAFFVFVFAACMAIAGGVDYLTSLYFPFIFACAGIVLSVPLSQKQRARKPIQRKVVA